MFGHQISSSSNWKSKTKPTAQDDGDDEGGHGALPEVGSQFSSSCEIFSLFKAMAAGKKDRQPFHVEVDSDESEDEPISNRPSSESEEVRDRDQACLKHAGSARTVRQSDILHGHDSEEDEGDTDDRDTLVEGGMNKEETLRRWQNSFGSSNAELDAQGSKLAGKCPV